MEGKKSVGIWIRVSTEDQAKGESPEHHEHRAKAYAAVKEWEVKEVYHLEGFSGKSVMNHPETQRMLKDIREGNISGLIFSKLARLARNTRELLDFADIFRENEADLVSLQESIDTSTPSGRMFYTMIAASAQWEREEIADRVAASVPVRASMGKPLGGQASFGYRWDNKNLVIDENEAPVRKLVYDIFLKHKRKKTTAEQLNKLGYRTRIGSLFTSTTIGRLLKDSTAKGIRLANYTKSTGDGKKWIIKPEKDWVKTPCPAIVSEEIWDECNRILDEQEQKRIKPGPKPVHLLSGYVFCTCGKKMYVYHHKTSATATYACKACRNRVSETDLDEIYHEKLQNFLMTDSEVSEYLMKSDTSIQEKQELLSKVESEATSIRKRMNELVNMRINGELTKDAFMIHYKPLEEQILQLDHNIPELQAEIDFLKIQLHSADTIMHDAKDLYKRWPHMGFEEKRAIVEVITEKIVIDKEDISLVMAYLPAHPSSSKSGKKFTQPQGFILATNIKPAG